MPICVPKLRRTKPILIKAPSRGRYSHVQQGWETVGEKKIYFRSKLEKDYARYLEWRKTYRFIKDWEHEPKCFWFNSIKRGTRSYLPDFRIINFDGTHQWVECKGFMDAKSKTKLKRFARFYPDEHLDVIYRKDFEQLKDHCRKYELLFKPF